VSGRFAGLKNLQQLEEEPVANTTTLPQETPIEDRRDEPPSSPAVSPRPWEQSGPPVEPVKALNGRVPRSVRLAFDRQLTDAMSTLGMDVTVDLAVEALARLVIENEVARDLWLRSLWELKRRP